MNQLARNSLPGVLILLLCLLAFPPLAEGAVERKGVWPPNETVSLSLTEVPRSEAVRRLAEEAHLSLVQEGVGQEPVSLSVHAEPADKVLMMLLSDRDYVVERDGTLVSVRSLAPASAMTQNAAKVPHVATPTKPDEDLFVPEKGYVGPDQVVRDVFVFGSVVIEGTVTGTVVLFGGKAELRKGSRVREDVIAFGGSLDIDDGVEIGGDVAALFGTLKRGAMPEKSCLACVEEKKEPWEDFFETTFGNVAAAAIAWLLGGALIALAPRRVEVLRAEVEGRPLRALGLGLLGALGLLVTVATLAITLIGIPLAVVLFFGTLIVSYLGFCVLPLAVGRRLTGERSRNPYVHQAIGCTLLFAILSIPIVGGLLGFVGTLIALGGLIRTKGAGPD